MINKNYYQVLIVGGGAAGISVAHSLLNKLISSDIAIIEPSDAHYYQPMWTLVGAGIIKKEKTKKSMQNVIPFGVKWIHNSVTEFFPSENKVILKNGNSISYDYLVVVPGMELYWNQIEGLEQTIGENGVCSIYSYNTVDYTWETIKNFTGGEALFTFPSTPIKCGGAPQKIMYLAEDYFRKNKIRQKVHIAYMSAGASIFAVKKYADALTKLVIEPRNIETCFQKNLVAVNGATKEAVFEDVVTQERILKKFDMLHVVPPMGTPAFVKKSCLVNSQGFINVNKETTQHVVFSNIFSIGDASSLPTSRTAAAVRASFPILVENLSLVMKAKLPTKSYDGYTSCPLVTRYGRVMLAEFDYNLTPKETMPFNQARESFISYILKRYIIPIIYWRGMLKGEKWPMLRSLFKTR